MVQVLRNGIETDKFQPVPIPDNDKPVIAIIGRLSGPKGSSATGCWARCWIWKPAGCASSAAPRCRRFAAFSGQGRLRRLCGR